MSEWKEYKLGSLAEITSSKRIFYSDYVSEGIPFFRSKEIIERSLGESGGEPLYISRDKYFEIKEKFGAPEDGDLLISAVGERAGIPYVVKNQGDFYFKDGNLIWLRNIKPELNCTYFNYWLKSNVGQQTLENIMIGSAQKALTIIGLKHLTISLPSPSYQGIVAETLSSLDDKIALLHRQNKTLEALAETLFRQWFVEEAEEGWETGKLGDFGKIICGKTPSKKIHSYFGGDIPFIKIPDMHGKTFVFDTEDTLTEEGAKSQRNKFLPPKSISVSCIATVGLVTMNAFDSQTNQQINSIIPSKEIYRYFLYLKLATMKDELLAMASGGTATDNLNTGNFSDIDIIKPDDNLLGNFHNQVQVFFDKIFTNQTQIRTLTRLRDTLLPKLMSGDVRVEN